MLPNKLAEECAETILTKSTSKKRKSSKNSYKFDLTSEIIRICGVDLTTIPGINSSTALLILSEIGTDPSKWRSAKHFASWLGLSPGNKISGGKCLSGKTKPCANKVAVALRMAASTLWHAKCAFGAYLRRMRARLGSPKAITAMAHKLAKVIYSLLKYGNEFFEKGQDHYENIYKKKVEQNLQRKARKLGYKLVKIQSVDS